MSKIAIKLSQMDHKVFKKINNNMLGKLFILVIFCIVEYPRGVVLYMKLPICYFCAKTKMLCPIDQKKLERGEISQLDVDISHELVMLKEKSFPELDKIEFIKSIRIQNITIILVRGMKEIEKSLIKISRELEKRGYGKVRFVEREKDIKFMVEQVIFPSRVLGVNILWLPDGSSEYTVRISHRDARRMPMKKDQAEEVLSKLLGKYVRIIYV